jgi:hypothetical protein
MVNKAALSVLGVIVLVSMGVGVLIGMQIGGGGADMAGATSPTADGGAPGENGDSSVDDPTTVPGGEVDTVRPPSERTTVPARRFSAGEIRDEIKSLVNERRESQGLSALRVDGQIVDQLDAMAHGHSNEMADEGRVTHNVGGNTSRLRYENADLFSICQFESDPGTYVVDARYNRLELIGHVVAGRTHDGKFLETESDVAAAIVSDWLSGTSRDRLFYENAGRIGAGVEVTSDGDVYATANLC